MKPIRELVDEELKKENEKPRSRSGKFSPSMFGRCFKAQIYNRADVPKTDEPEERVLRVFKSGKLFHDFVQAVIVKSNPNINTEVKVEEDDVIGFADIVEDNAVTDLKTVHSRAFHYMDDDITESKKPNILQVMYYTRMLGKKIAKLCFISKDDLSMREYAFTLNEKWNEELNYELNTLRDLWVRKMKTEKLPPPKPRAYMDKKGKSKECEYCSWKTLCLGKQPMEAPF